MLMLSDRQLGREGQAEEDNWYRPHALPEDCSSIVQEWLPARFTKGREGTYGHSIKSEIVDRFAMKWTGSDMGLFLGWLVVTSLGS